MIQNTSTTDLVTGADVFATVADIVGAKYLPTRFGSNADDSRYNGQKRIQDGLSLRSFLTTTNRCNGYEYCWHRDGGSTRNLYATEGARAVGVYSAIRNATHKYRTDGTTEQCYSMSPADEVPAAGIACDATHDMLEAAIATLEATGN